MILLLIFFVCKPRPKIEPIYCTNMYEHIHEDITKYNITRSKTTLEKLLQMKHRKYSSKYSGFDERNNTEDDSIVEIAENMRKYKLLQLLENGAIGELQKLEAIEAWHKMYGESLMASDLTKGGLFREWDWDF